MKFKKIFLLVPVLAGLTAGQLLGPGKKTESEKIYSPAVSPETSSPKQVPHSISRYLLTSQTLFSKAIALSGQENDQDKVAAQNQQIVTLINESITQATQAIANYPTDSRGWAQRAKIYASIEKYVDGSLKIARADMERAVELERQNPDYLKELSNLSLKLGDLARSVSWLEQAALASPTDAQLWFELAQRQTEAGELILARKNYQRVLPLLVNEEQKATVQKELAAIASLINQAGSLAIQPKPTQPTNSKELVLPDSPPKLEATHLSGRVIIAQPGEVRVESHDSETASNALSGNAVLSAGETEVKIEAANLSSQSVVYLAPVGNPENQVLRVKAKKAAGQEASGYFIAAIVTPLKSDLEFKWWIIEE